MYNLPEILKILSNCKGVAEMCKVKEIVFTYAASFNALDYTVIMAAIDFQIEIYQIMSILHINSKEQKAKASKALAKGKLNQLLNEDKGGKWVRTFKGYKFVKNDKK